MAITKEQRELRKKFMGSSDSAAVLGIDPYRSAADVWLEKTGRAEPFAGNENTDRGTLLEPVILDWAEQQIPKPFVRNHMAVEAYAGAAVMAANFDGFGQPVDGFIVEAKSSVLPDEWGTAGTDEVPDRVLIQTHHAMFVAGPEYRIAYVPVLLPGYRSFDFRLYQVQREDDLCNSIASKVREFWNVYVLTGTEPANFKPSIDVIKRVRREPNKVVPVADELVDEFVACRAAAMQAEKRKEESQAALLAALGNAEGGSYSRGIVTYMETTRSGYVVEPTAFRQLKIKVEKKKETGNDSGKRSHAANAA